MNKKRILIANDASFLDTGYGVYGKEIISRIHNSDKYEVAELGCYAGIGDSRIKNIPWKFYPNAVKTDDPRFQQYSSNNLNQFGLWRFNRCLVDFKPHIVFDVRDYWMYSYQDTSPYRSYFSWVIMPTTDSDPPKIEWLYTYQNAELVVPYTNFAKNVLQRSCGNKINLFPKIANAGINPNEFYPIENKLAHKIKYLGRDLNIVGVVMRNQKRKLIAELLLAFKMFLEQLKTSKQDDIYNKTYLYLHTSYPEENGWDIPSLLLEYGLLDKVYFTYKCRFCNNVSVGKFHPSLKICSKCNNNFTANMLYNFFVNTSDDIKATNSDLIREKCLLTYTWDNVYRVWEEAFDTIDINSKLPWYHKNMSNIENTSIKVPINISGKEFIEFICLKVINDPHLLKTANIQSLIKDITNTLITRSGSIGIFDKKEALEILEGFFNNKIICEKMRTNPELITKEDFINAQ